MRNRRSVARESHAHPLSPLPVHRGPPPPDDAGSDSSYESSLRSVSTADSSRLLERDLPPLYKRATRRRMRALLMFLVGTPHGHQNSLLAHPDLECASQPDRLRLGATGGEEVYTVDARHVRRRLGIAAPRRRGGGGEKGAVEGAAAPQVRVLMREAVFGTDGPYCTLDGLVELQRRLPVLLRQPLLLLRVARRRMLGDRFWFGVRRRKEELGLGADAGVAETLFAPKRGPPPARVAMDDTVRAPCLPVCGVRPRVTLPAPAPAAVPRGARDQAALGGAALGRARRWRRERRGRRRGKRRPRACARCEAGQGPLPTPPSMPGQRCRGEGSCSPPPRLCCPQEAEQSLQQEQKEVQETLSRQGAPGDEVTAQHMRRLEKQQQQREEVVRKRTEEESRLGLRRSASGGEAKEDAGARLAAMQNAQREARKREEAMARAARGGGGSPKAAAAAGEGKKESKKGGILSSDQRRRLRRFMRRRATKGGAVGRFSSRSRQRRISELGADTGRSAGQALASKIEEATARGPADTARGPADTARSTARGDAGATARSGRGGETSRTAHSGHEETVDEEDEEEEGYAWPDDGAHPSFATETPSAGGDDGVSRRRSRWGLSASGDSGDLVDPALGQREMARDRTMQGPRTVSGKSALRLRRDSVTPGGEARATQTVGSTIRRDSASTAAAQAAGEEDGAEAGGSVPTAKRKGALAKAAAWIKPRKRQAAKAAPSTTPKPVAGSAQRASSHQPASGAAASDAPPPPPPPPPGEPPREALLRGVVALRRIGASVAKRKREGGEAEGDGTAGHGAAQGGASPPLKRHASHLARRRSDLGAVAHARREADVRAEGGDSVLESLPREESLRGASDAEVAAAARRAALALAAVNRMEQRMSALQRTAAAVAAKKRANTAAPTPARSPAPASAPAPAAPTTAPGRAQDSTPSGEAEIQGRAGGGKRRLRVRLPRASVAVARFAASRATAAARKRMPDRISWAKAPAASGGEDETSAVWSVVSRDELSAEERRALERAWGLDVGMVLPPRQAWRVVAARVVADARKELSAVKKVARERARARRSSLLARTMGKTQGPGAQGQQGMSAEEDLLRRGRRKGRRGRGAERRRGRSAGPRQRVRGRGGGRALSATPGRSRAPMQGPPTGTTAWVENPSAVEEEGVPGAADDAESAEEKKGEDEDEGKDAGKGWVPGDPTRPERREATGKGWVAPPPPLRSRPNAVPPSVRAQHGAGGPGAGGGGNACAGQAGERARRGGAGRREAGAGGQAGGGAAEGGGVPVRGPGRVSHRGRRDSGQALRLQVCSLRPAPPARRGGAHARRGAGAHVRRRRRRRGAGPGRRAEHLLEADLRLAVRGSASAAGRTPHASPDPCFGPSHPRRRQRPFYFNVRTGLSRWTKPPEVTDDSLVEVLVESGLEVGHIVNVDIKGLDDVVMAGKGRAGAGAGAAASPGKGAKSPARGTAPDAEADAQLAEATVTGVNQDYTFQLKLKGVNKVLRHVPRTRLRPTHLDVEV